MAVLLLGSGAFLMVWSGTGVKALSVLGKGVAGLEGIQWLLSRLDVELSEEERNKIGAEALEALQKAGGKMIVMCFSGWSTEQWRVFGVKEFPDIEAVQEHAQFLVELDHGRYMESYSMLGTEYPLP